MTIYTVENTLRVLLSLYPSLFDDWTDAAEKIIMGYGHGYEWYEGAIRQELDQEKEDARLAMPIEGLIQLGLTKIDEMEVDKPYCQYMLDLWRFRIENLESQMNMSVTMGFDFRSYKEVQEYSPLANMPDIINDDWFELIRKVISQFEYRLNLWTNYYYYKDQVYVAKQKEKIREIKTRFTQIQANKLGMSVEELEKKKAETNEEIRAMIRELNGKE